MKIEVRKWFMIKNMDAVDGWFFKFKFVFKIIYICILNCNLFLKTNISVIKKIRVRDGTKLR